MSALNDAELGPLPEGTPAMRPTILLTYAEAANHLRISEREVRRMVHEDKLPVLKFGRLPRIAYDDLKAWVKRQRHFESYFITPDTFKLQRRQVEKAKLDRDFSWD